jgi:hypothetical protein
MLIEVSSRLRKHLQNKNKSTLYKKALELFTVGTLALTRKSKNLNPFLMCSAEKY